MFSLISPVSSRASAAALQAQTDAAAFFLVLFIEGAACHGMIVGAGGHHQLVPLGQLVAVGAVHQLFNQPQEQGGYQSQDQVADHLNGGGGEVQVVHAHDVAVLGEELRKADDEHDGGILHVDDVVVADLGHDVPQGLGHDDIHHGLEVGHADGLGALRLAGVDGDDAASDGFRHVRAGVDGHDQQGGGKDVVEPQGVVGEVGQAVVNKHGLQHHGRATKDLHINADDDPQQLQKEPLGQGIVLRIGDGIQDTAQQADEAADQRGQKGQLQRVPDTAHIHGTVFIHQQGHVLSQLYKLVHDNSPFQ